VKDVIKPSIRGRYSDSPDRPIGVIMGPTPTFMKVKPQRAFDAKVFLRSAGTGKTIVTYQPTDVIFSQGDASDSVLYIQEGSVKLSVPSHGGKEAVVALLGPGDSFRGAGPRRRPP
jgi:Cyclic nucleotide-binding domain